MGVCKVKEWAVPETDIAAMTEEYPDWRVHSRGNLGGWEGPIQPLPPEGDTQGVLAAIWQGEAIRVELGGVLAPAGAGRRHLPGWLRKVRDLSTTFQVRLFYLDPPLIPYAVCMVPEISWRTHPRHPHLFQGEAPFTYPSLAALCPFLPSDNVWQWGRDSVARLVDFVSIWLVNHMVYDRTGRWPGAAARHDSKWLLENVRAESVPCVCGNPVPYENCCRPLHELVVGRNVLGNRRHAPRPSGSGRYQTDSRRES